MIANVRYEVFPFPRHCPNADPVLFWDHVEDRKEQLIRYCTDIAARVDGGFGVGYNLSAWRTHVAVGRPRPTRAD